MHVGERILKYFVIPICKFGIHPQITISLEKPTAVTFADAPVVEITIDSDPDKNPMTKSMWGNATKIQRPPFPLQGWLDEWITSNKIKMVED
jgi:hypothetical protein